VCYVFVCVSHVFVTVCVCVCHVSIYLCVFMYVCVYVTCKLYLMWSMEPLVRVCDVQAVLAVVNGTAWKALLQPTAVHAGGAQVEQVCVHVCVWVFVHVYVCVFAHVCMCACVWVCVHVYVYVWVCV